MYGKGNRRSMQLLVIRDCTCEMESKLFSVFVGCVSESDAFLVASARFNLQTKSAVRGQSNTATSMHLKMCPFMELSNVQHLIATIKMDLRTKYLRWSHKSFNQGSSFKYSPNIETASLTVPKRKIVVREAINSFKHKY